jgi:hypothetical protein
MDSNRFDTITRLFADRRSRRTALKAGGASLAAAALLPFAARAQDAKPQGTPLAADDFEPHPSADTAKADPEFLFVQPFTNGTWAPKDGADGSYTLTLTGAAAQTVYFSDRPERIVGLSPMQQFLDTLGFTPNNPPNAALVATTESGEQDILVIELLNPAWDGSGTLTYDARVLADYADPGLANLARQQADYELAGTFGDGSLFIDDCSDWDIGCYDSSNNLVGTFEAGRCYHFPSGCSLCDDPQSICAEKFGQCSDCQRDATGACIPGTIVYTCTTNEVGG